MKGKIVATGLSHVCYRKKFWYPFFPRQERYRTKHKKFAAVQMGTLPPFHLRLSGCLNPGDETAANWGGLLWSAMIGPEH